MWTGSPLERARGRAEGNTYENDSFYVQFSGAVDAADMVPCSGSDSNCPSYGSKDNFNVAIETPKGKLPDGPLTACPS